MQHKKRKKYCHKITQGKQILKREKQCEKQFGTDEI